LGKADLTIKVRASVSVSLTKQSNEAAKCYLSELESLLSLNFLVCSFDVFKIEN